MRRLLVACVAASLWLLLPTSSASAGCGSATAVEGGDSTFDASSVASACSAQGDDTTTNVTDTPQPAGTDGWKYVCASDKGSQLCGGDYSTCADGTLMEQHYFYPADGGAPLSLGSNCPEDQPPAAGPSPADILRAFRQIPLPGSVLNIQPPGGATLVNFETNFYTDAAPFERTVTLLGHQVHFKIRARSFAWHFGDTSSATTSRPGAAYPKLEVTHRYREKGTVNPSVDTTWEADYRLDGGAWTQVNGTVTMRGAAQQLTVKSATPVLVG